MEKGLKVKTILNYEGKDVTADFAPILQSITFRDFLDGKAGELDIKLSDKESNFLADWYPETDDKIEAYIGYEDSEVMHCGSFWVDEVGLSGSSGGNDVDIRALSLKPSVIHSVVNKKIHSSRNIKDIVEEIATPLNYNVKGNLSGSWNGLQQETGLQFLTRLAHETGRIMKIEDNTLIFYLLSDIVSKTDSIIINRKDVINYDISDKAAGRISKCECRWWDKKTKKLIRGEYNINIKGGGSALIWQEVSDNSEAQKKAKDYITDRNKKGVEITLDLVGDVRLRAGVTVKLTGFGRFDTSYYISESEHAVSSGGYTTRITLEKVVK